MPSVNFRPFLSFRPRGCCGRSGTATLSVSTGGGFAFARGAIAAAAAAAAAPASGRRPTTTRAGRAAAASVQIVMVKILALDRDAILVVKNCSTSIRVEERLSTKIDVSGRIVRVPQLSLQDYVRLFGGSHVALETFPFGGSITSLDAFEGGTPVVSMKQFRARPALTVALYDIMKISCCVASDIDDYVQKAISIASDPSLRSSIRLSLDAARFRLYESMDAVLEIEAFFSRSLKLLKHIFIDGRALRECEKSQSPEPQHASGHGGHVHATPVFEQILLL